MRSFFIILFFVMCGAASGHTQVIRNANNLAIAKIESDGTVRNNSNFMTRTLCDVCLEDIHWLAFLPYGQVISPRDLMALPLSRHPSGIHNG